MLTSFAIRPTSQRHMNAHERQGVPSLSRFNPWSQTKEGAALTDKHRPTCPPEDTGPPGDEHTSGSLLWLSWEGIEGLIPIPSPLNKHQGTLASFLFLFISPLFSLSHSLSISPAQFALFSFAPVSMRIWAQRGGEERGREACQLTRLTFFPPPHSSDDER